MNRPMTGSLDRVADIYDETRRMPPEVLVGIMDNVRSEVDPAGGPLIELGIGTGRIAVPLAEAGFNIVGVDVSEIMLARLRKNVEGKAPARLNENAAGRSYSIRAVRGDVMGLPFANDSFGAAIAVHVFHLLDDMEACLYETRRVLAPGGCLLFGGEQRMLRYLDKALTEQFAELLIEAGIKLPDQDEVERKVAEYVSAMGGDLKQLRPVEWDFEISADDVIDRIENRVASYLWDVSDKRLSDLVRRLRILYEQKVGPPSAITKLRRSFKMFCARF